MLSHAMSATQVCVLSRIPFMNASKMIAGSLVIASACLAGCEGQVSVDLGTTAPADRAVVQVLADLEGVEFREAGGGTSRLEFNDPQRVDLIDFLQGNLFRLFTDEELSDGHYTGVRLLFADDSDDDDDAVVLANNEDRPLQIVAGDFSTVDFTVDKNDSSRDRVVLTLDLRQSLAFDDDNDRYTLTPVLLGIRAEDAGQLSGSVTANCSAGGTLAQGGAAYVFVGSSITPDDRDTTAPEPYLTTAIEADANNVLPTFDFPFLPEGDYTLSLTCNGNEDDAATNDDVRFQNTTNVTVEQGERTTQNLQ